MVVTMSRTIIRKITARKLTKDMISTLERVESTSQEASKTTRRSTIIKRITTKLRDTITQLKLRVCINRDPRREVVDKNLAMKPKDLFTKKKELRTIWNNLDIKKLKYPNLTRRDLIKGWIGLNTLPKSILNMISSIRKAIRQRSEGLIDLKNIKKDLIMRSKSSTKTLKNRCNTIVGMIEEENRESKDTLTMINIKRKTLAKIKL
jgi:hypothetical protein